MNNNLPKMFCITLKCSPKRTAYAGEHFKNHGLDVEMFYGINGKKFGLHTLIPYMDDQPNWKPGDGTPHYMSQGHVGCILSHYMLWQTLSYLPYDEIIIFEDDVVLCDDFKKKLIEYKNQLPNDWDYVFVGYCCLAEKQTKVTTNIITLGHPPMCTHAYMIKKSSIPILLDTNHVAWSHIDIQIQKRSLKQLKHYVMVPMLASQKSIDPTQFKDFYSLTK